MKRKGFILLLIFIVVFPFTLCAQDLDQIGDSTAIKLSGAFGARAIFYDATGGEARRQPFTYLFTANAAVSIYELNIPFSFTFANQQFQFSQPFNQIGASPNYKWLTVHLGHRNIQLSQFTLAGHQMLGAGVEVNPGKLRASIMYGRLLKAVPEDTTLISLRRPSYDRVGYGAKIGYGSANDFIDLILFKAEDDENSLESEDPPETIRPGENVVFGINTRKTFLNKRLTFFFDGAVSTFTLDKQLEIGEFDIPSGLDWAGGLITTNASTQVYSAFKTGLSFRSKKIQLAATAQRIDSDYRSMGLYFINNDVLAYAFQPSFSLWKGKIRVNGGITFQRDNLNNKKVATAKRTIPQVNVSVSPFPNFNLVGSYTNLTTLMEEGAVPLDNAFKQDQKNPIYSLTANYIKSDTIRAHSISVFGNRSELKDNNITTREFSQYVGNTANATYSFNQLNRHYGFYLSFNYNELQTFTGTLPGTGFSTGINKSFFERKLNFSTSGSYAKQDQTNSKSFAFTTTYQFDNHQISLNANYLNTELITGAFNEFTGFVNYSIRF